MIKTILGIICICIPFILMTIAIIKAFDIKALFIIYGGSLFMSALIIFGLYLLTGV